MKELLIIGLAILFNLAGTEKTYNNIITPESNIQFVQTTESKNTYKYYDIPLDTEIQRYVIDKCKSNNNITPELIFAMIERESQYDASKIGDNGNSYGLLQIQPRWHSARMSKLGVNDLLNPYQNINVAFDLLTELFAQNTDKKWVLMTYNGGSAYANQMIKNGTISDYASYVLERMKSY